MGIEFELKFRAAAAQQNAILAKYPQLAPISMETTYYDTPDRGLSLRRWTLRQRYENGRPVCTLKTPAPGGARGEWEAECGSILEGISELCKLGAPEELLSLTKNGVVEVCGAKFTRLAGTLRLENCTVELALDRGILTGGGREIPLCEIEVELKSGPQAAAVAFAMELAEKYDLVPEKKSKYRRALSLAEGR